MALSTRRMSVFVSVGLGCGEAVIWGDGVCVTVLSEGETLALASGRVAVVVAVGETISTVDAGLGVIVTVDVPSF